VNTTDASLLYEYLLTVCKFIWNDSKALAQCAQTELVKPRQASHQRHRANTPVDNDEEYYRRACYIPFLDSLIAELESRFTGHCEAVCRLRYDTIRDAILTCARKPT